METFSNPPGGLNPQEVETQDDQEDPLKDRQKQAGDTSQEDGGADDAPQGSEDDLLHRMPPVGSAPGSRRIGESGQRQQDIPPILRFTVSPIHDFSGPPLISRPAYRLKTIGSSRRPS